jgi:tripartite ATP-independent transporter DctM subunit
MNTIAWGSALLIGLLFLGIPVAVVMVAVGIVGGIVAFGPVFIDNIGSVVWSTQNENLLTAIPLFILLGEILLRSGLADRMYTSLAVWLGRLPGGLLHTNIGACALFAATCGSSAATAATVGTVAIPNLVKRGYALRPSLGSLAAGGTLGILIPPSVALLVYGSLTNTSVGQLFIAGIVPGILLTLSFVLLVIGQSFVGGWRRTESGPSLPFIERLKSLRHLLPVFFVFAVVMGGLYFGWATPTEAAALGVFIALVIAKVFGRLSLARLHECFRHTAVLTGMMILILVGAFVLNVTLSLSGIPQRITDWMVAFGVTPGQLVLCMVVLYLILGCFLDVLSMQVTTIPIAFPIITHFGIDPIWFGIFVTLMSEVAMITPPVGLNLFVIQSIRTDGGDIRDVIVGSAPYVIVMLLFVALVWYAQEIVLWLPRTML